MRTANALIFADIAWPDGVELPEQVMRDLCPHVAMHIAEFFAEVCDEHPQLLEGKVHVNWGAPITPEHLLEQLQQEGHMGAGTLERTEEQVETELPELDEEQQRAIAEPEIAEEQAPVADPPPAKSWGVYVYNAQAVAPEPQCHIYGYDGSGNPLTEADATELAALLSVGHSGTVMALPNEEAPPITPSVNHDQA